MIAGICMNLDSILQENKLLMMFSRMTMTFIGVGCKALTLSGFKHLHHMITLVVNE
jgi:hypothetical protein